MIGSIITSLLDFSADYWQLHEYNVTEAGLSIVRDSHSAELALAVENDRLMVNSVLLR